MRVPQPSQLGPPDTIPLHPQTAGRNPDFMLIARSKSKSPDTGRTLSDVDIRRELVVFLAAGHDTTATTLTYGLWALGGHPEVQDRVAAEVAAVGDRPLTADDVPRLSYTVQVLHEALRLCPPGPAITRMVMKDFDVDGYRVEAGSGVTGRDLRHASRPGLWDHPLVFDPKRFQPG